MTSVEKNITARNVERARNHPEFQKRREREQTHVAMTPDLLDAFRPMATPFESVYLPGDGEFSLRVRAEYTPEGIVYTTALKDEGEMDGDALDRMEVSAQIDPETYAFYASHPDFPDVKYLRAEPLSGLTIDFIEGRKLPQVEYEAERNAPEHPFMAVLKNGLVDMSSDPSVRKEVIAHQLKGREIVRQDPEAMNNFVQRMMRDMVATYTMGYPQVVAGISGISGSGKTTAVRQLVESFVKTFGEEFRPVVLSSDDYHRGKKWLEENYGAPWTEWDDPRVYNTKELAEDLKRLKAGESVVRQHFDFATEEVVVDGEINPSPFVIVEGLYAGSPDLREVRNLHYEMPTSIATSIGRDIRRLLIENRANGSIGTPEDRLKYVMEIALPTYLKQKRPRANSFSMHSRPLAERAFMLDQLSR